MLYFSWKPYVPDNSSARCRPGIRAGRLAEWVVCIALFPFGRLWGRAIAGAAGQAAGRYVAPAAGQYVARGARR